MEKKQSFGLRKKDLAVIGALLLLAVSCWLAYRLSYRPPEKQNLAVIMIFSLEEDYGVPVSFQIEIHKIRFIQVTCPDHICENAGFLSMEGQSAVCMPNRTSLSIYGEEG